MTQILETEKLLSMVQGHPIMEPSLKERLEILKKELSEIPDDYKESKIRLLFSGKAVVGSEGIKSEFVSKTIKPVQELIKTETAVIKFGEVGLRGQAKKSKISELYLTALPTGSFGYELSLLNHADLFEDGEVSQSIQNIINIIETTAKSDEGFENIIEHMSKRSLNNLTLFFKEVANEDSILKMESGTSHVELTKEEIKRGFVRIQNTVHDETTIVIQGIFKGILLDSGRFEIVDDIGVPIRGTIHESLEDEELTEYNKEFTNEECKITILESITTFNENKRIRKYELLKIERL